MYAVSAQWLASVNLSHKRVCKVEAWQYGAKIGEFRPLDGAVQDSWRIGIRRTLTLSVAPSDADLVKPGIELRPFTGIVYGTGAPEVVPHGVFPVTASDVSLRPDALSVTASDSWSYAMTATFVRPMQANKRLTVAQQVVQLLQHVGPWDTVTNTASSTAMMQPQVFTGTYSDTISALVQTIGAEVGIGRDGVPFLRNRPALGTSVADFQGGNDGRLLNAVESVDFTRMFNAVSVTGTNPDPVKQFPPLIVRILDPTHPAYARPGVPMRVFELAGPQYTGTVQGQLAGKKKLSKVSAAVRSISMDCIPDTSLDASDTIRVDIGNGLERVQIDTIGHPFAALTTQPITTATGRDDDA